MKRGGASPSSPLLPLLFQTQLAAQLSSKSAECEALQANVTATAQTLNLTLTLAPTLTLTRELLGPLSLQSGGS